VGAQYSPRQAHSTAAACGATASSQ
jgi:hypothetical protein